MSSYCHDVGINGSCNIDECDRFMSAECERPEEIVGFEDINNLDEETINDICNAYPQLIKYLMEKKEEVMSNNKIENGLNLQKEDRVAAANKIHGAALRLTKIEKPTVFFTDECTEVFSKEIKIPVKVVCYESRGERQVYINAHRADPISMGSLVSKELIDCFSELKDKVDKIDSGLGCENLDKLAGDTL